MSEISIHFLRYTVNSMASADCSSFIVYRKCSLLSRFQPIACVHLFHVGVARLRGKKRKTEKPGNGGEHVNVSQVLERRNSVVGEIKSCFNPFKASEPPNTLFTKQPRRWCMKSYLKFMPLISSGCSCSFHPLACFNLALSKREPPTKRRHRRGRYTPECTRIFLTNRTEGSTIYRDEEQTSLSVYSLRVSLQERRCSWLEGESNPYREQREGQRPARMAEGTRVKPKEVGGTHKDKGRLERATRIFR